MSTLPARYFDGRAAAGRDVRVNLTIPGLLSFEDGADRHRYRLDEFVVSPRLAGQPGVVDLPDGGRLEIDDADAFHAAISADGKGGRDWEHRLESAWSRVLIALVVTGIFAWLGATYGIPFVARVIAGATPVNVDRTIGEEGLALVDERLFAPSELPVERQEALRGVFADVVDAVGDEHAFRIEFRVGNETGPNAFALPSGIVIVTDELVAVAEHDDELAAVMAHEVGHARQRHALRSLIQNSLVAGLLFVMLGDPSAATTIAAGIPTFLLDRSYSREFEREADDVAFQYLALRGIPDRRFGDLMERLEQADGDSELPGLLSTHPRAGERVRRAAPL
jgi:Zn-dependent protease with chaperone function